MGRAGGGGGGRSSGGGGGRASGGRIGGSSGRAGGGSNFGGSNFGGNNFGGGNFGGFNNGHHHHHYRPVPIYTTPRVYRTGNSTTYSPFSGIATIIVVAVIILMTVLLVNVADGGSSSNSITVSTVARQPLPSGSVNETAYYTDTLNWIDSSSTLEAGMRAFYQKTGVQPYLYITDTINGKHQPTESDFDIFANQLYDQLFTDEAHLLLLFHEYNGVYSTWYMAGTQAKSVIDKEASNILLDYVDRYYYTNMSEAEMFGTAFSDTAERIMKVTRPSWYLPTIIIGSGIVLAVILVIAFKWWKKHKEQQNLEAKQTQELLDTPLDSFGDEELLREMRDKYNK